MPGGDRTGPEGAGPMTGRQQGYCAGSDAPGYTSGTPGFARRGAGFRGGGGFGRGARGGGRGRGRGMGYRYADPLVRENEELRRRLDEIESRSGGEKPES